MSDPWPPRPPGEEAPRRPAADAGSGTPRSPAPAGSEVSPGEDEAPIPSANRRALAIALGMVALLIVVAALAAGPVAAPGSPTFPPVGATSAPARAGAAATRSAVAAALAGVGLQAEDVLAPYRPAEGPRLAAAPRIVVRATLPDDPDHGRIVIYEFVTPNDASVAAGDQAAYLASGVGRVQFPPDTRFTIRVVDSTVVFFAWSPGSSLDPRTSQIAEALATLGLEVVVPN